MKRLQYILLFGVMMAAMAATSRAQDTARVRVGPMVSAGIGIDRPSIPVFPGSTDCGVYENGTSFLIGGGALLQFPRMFGEALGLQIGAEFMMASSRLTATPVDPTRIVDAGVLVELQREYRLAATQRDALVEIQATYALGERLMLAVGPRLGLSLGATYEATDNVLGPGDYSFASGQREQPLAGAALPEPASLTFGPVVSASYMIPFGAARLTPGVRLGTDVLSRTKVDGWRRITAEATLALLFDIIPSPAPPPPPEKPIEPVIVVAPERPRLSASITLVGLDENNQPVPVSKVHVNEVLVRRHAPLLPAVFFEQEKTDLPSRYPALDSAGANVFGVDELADLDVLELQHRALDVIGDRMRRLPASKLGLVGSVSRDEAPSIARARAASVKRYLERVWGIDPGRITIQDGNGTMLRSNEATEDGRADNRRVEFVGSTDALVAPVVTEQVEREFDPPLIRMSPSYEAEAGMKSWQLNVKQGQNTIAHYTNDSVSLAAAELTWHLASENIDSGLAPLEAELQVEDSTGRSVTARSQVPLVLERTVSVVDRRVVREGDRENISFTLVGFEYNLADINRRNLQVIREAAALIHPGARIVVTGYTDRQGMEQRNAELSADRARRVAAALREQLEANGVNDVSVQAAGAGIDTERFQNDLPEGRALSRGVYIQVEQGGILKR